MRLLQNNFILKSRVKLIGFFSYYKNDFLLTNRHMIYSYGYVKLYWAVTSVALFFYEVVIIRSSYSLVKKHLQFTMTVFDVHFR